MSTKPSLFVRAAAVLLAATALTTFSVSSNAAEQAHAAITQTPPAIRVVSAEPRELVEKLSVTGTIVAREEAAAGTDLNGLTVVALNADQGDMVMKGEVARRLDRSTLDTQLAQTDASRAQAEANIAQSGPDRRRRDRRPQAEEEHERAEALQKKGVAAQAQFDNAVNASDSATAKLGSAEKALSASQAQIAVIDAQKTEYRDPDRQDRSEGAGRRPGAGPQRHAWRHRLVDRRRRCSASPSIHEFELAADVPRRHCRGSARHAGRSALPAGGDPSTARSG